MRIINTFILNLNNFLHPDLTGQVLMIHEKTVSANLNGH